MGEAYGTSPLELLSADDHDWLILLATAEVLRRDAKAREEEREGESTLPEV